MNKFIIEDVYNNKMYYFTGVSSPQETVEVVLTQYTTPVGTKISDNAYVNPKTLTLQLFTSSISMSPQKEFDVASNTFKDLTMTEIKTIIDNWTNNAIKLNITSFESYFENMYITNISSTEQSLYMWKPSITFTQVRQAQPSYIQLEFPKDAQESADNNTEQDMGANNGISTGDVGTAVGGTAGGALLGAAIGSIIPGIGTAIGAALGGIAGFFISILS